MKRALLVAAAASLAVGCHRHGETLARDCAPATGEVTAASVPSMEGTFGIVMVATGGSHDGQRATGHITLRAAPTGSAAPSATARTALIGTLDVPLEEVGALRLGNTTSQDPAAPGVAVYVADAANGGTTVSGRIGSATTVAPDPNMQPIEGAYTAFFISRVRADGFDGVWRSAQDINSMASGYFCAVRSR